MTLDKILNTGIQETPIHPMVEAHRVPNPSSAMNLELLPLHCMMARGDL